MVVTVCRRADRFQVSGARAPVTSAMGAQHFVYENEATVTTLFYYQNHEGPYRVTRCVFSATDIQYMSKSSEHIAKYVNMVNFFCLTQKYFCTAW